MLIYENECVCCDLPCIGEICPNHKVSHYFCDKCNYETQLYQWGIEELCLDCIKEKLDKVN